MTTKEELQALRQKFDSIGTKIKGLIEDYNLQKLSIESLTDRNNEIEKDLNDLAYEIEQGVQPVQYGRWKPKEGEEYYFITDMTNDIGIDSMTWANDNQDDFLYSIGNCFRTREQAEQAFERLKIRTQLEDIALRLNKGRKIDWENRGREKYYLFYDWSWGEICSTTVLLQSDECVYCLNKNFKDVAIAEIGEERLAKYLKGE